MKQIRFDENYITGKNDSFSPDYEQIKSVIDSPAVENLMEKNLTEKQKLYITLYYKKGMTLEKIGEKYGVNVSTVSRTIERGRNRIFSGLEKDCFRRLLGGDKK